MCTVPITQRLIQNVVRPRAQWTFQGEKQVLLASKLTKQSVLETLLMYI